MTDQFEDLAGCPAVGADGEVAGAVSQVYVSDATGRAEWVMVSAGREGGGDRFAPLAGSVVQAGQLILAVPARLIAAAPWPGLDSAGRLSPAGASVLFAYYASSPDVLEQEPSPAGPTPGQQEDTGHHANPDADAPDANGVMIVSEERLRAAARTVVTGRARLVKYTVTEEVTMTVTVSREEARIEWAPAPGGPGQAAISADGEQAPPEGSSRSGPGGWLVLHAERPVVQLESVPVERVRLRVETVTGQQDITGQIRKEQVGKPEIESLPGAG